MKKKIYYVLPLLLLLLTVTTGCQKTKKNGKGSSSSSSLVSSSSKSSKKSESSSDKAKSSPSSEPSSQASSQTTESQTQTDLYAPLLKGDYSLIAGTWQNQVDSLTIAEDGIILGGLSLTDARLDGQVVIMTLDSGNGSSQTLYYIPAGVELPQTYFYPEGGGDVSDTSRERLVLTSGLLFGNNNYRDHVYYRSN